MKDIIIAGAGGFGREALTLIKRINKVEKRWNIKGFINDKPEALDGIECEYGIIGNIQDWQPSVNEVFVIGIASPKGKQKVAEILKSKGAKFETLISPQALIADHVTIGEGCVITGFSCIGDCASLGSFVNVAGSMIGQDAVLGDYTTTTGYANITNARLGKRVFVGSHAVILNKLNVGDDAYISVGSIVMRNVKPNEKVLGYPAKKLVY